MDFKNVPKKYRPVPFWSWNEKLNTEETRRQIDVMDKAGMGGFFMHARGGLQTEYMGEEWFDNVKASADEAERRGMYAWAYDENGWPSGFGAGKINGKGLKYQQKYLRVDDKTDGENTIAVIGGNRFYYDVNPFYVDLLDADVTKAFIDEIYEPYYKRFKNDITGFFTDEPQISRNGLPWSLILPSEYEKAYGEEIYPHLNELFEDVGDYKETRVKYWKLITDLFSKNFAKQIYDWCTERGLAFTGHLVCEETFVSQAFPNGAVMPLYEYFTIPGMDNLSRNINTSLISYQLGSAAAQTGKKQVLSETFALCGHNVSFEELKGIYEHQMVHGINLLCQHLEGYSLRGIRKRDYPPALFSQQPWWDRYKIFNDTMSRTGMILSEGKCDYDVLVLHPQTTAWSYIGGKNFDKAEQYYDEYLDFIHDLDNKHIPFHLGDETLIERHGRVDGDKFIVGEMTYKTIVMPPFECMLLDTTKKLFDEFKKNGGKIISADEIIQNRELTDSTDVLYTKRVYDDFDIYYIINPSADEHTVTIKKGGKLIDAKTGDIIPFDGEHTFLPYDSIIVLDDGTPQRKKIEKNLKQLDLSGKWKIESTGPNVITLDKCTYKFDGISEEENGYVLNIQNRACALKRPVNIYMEYTFNAEYLPEDLCFVCETPENFDIKVNGKAVEKQEKYDYFRDKAFKMINIYKYAVKGENKITLETEFKQSEETYKNISDSLIFESVKNMLVYDMEIEPCYLTGSFGVKTSDNFTELERDASRYSGDFIMTSPPEYVTLKNIERQGFPFFAGDMTLVKEFTLNDTDYEIAFDKTGVNAIDVSVNDNDISTMLFHPFTADISDVLLPGNNTVKIRFFNNLRNMMGPHHLEEGESYGVGPASFFKEKCVWCPNGEKSWGGGIYNDNYCFVNLSLVK